MKQILRLFPKVATFQEKKIVFENFISLTTLQALGYLLPMITLPYLTRVIGLANFGLIAFAQAFMQYFMIITDYGFSLSATKKISMCGQNKKHTCEIFSTVMAVKLILALICFLLLLVFINLVPKFKQDWLVYLFSFGTVLGNTLFPVWFFQGKEKMAYITLINSLAGIANVICIFYYVNSPSDYIYIPLINSIFSLISGSWALYIAFKKFDLQIVSRTYKNIREEMRAGWQLFISIVAINAYTATRVFAVGLLTNNTITGYYSVAERIANFIQSFPLYSFTQAVYPRLNKVFLKNKERAAKIMPKVQKISTVGFLICLPILFYFSPLITRLICGEPFNAVTTTLRILLISILFVGANAFRVQYFLICGRIDLYAKLHLTAALIGLPLVFILLYLFSYTGVAISTIVIEAGVFFATGVLIKKLI